MQCMVSILCKNYVRSILLRWRTRCLTASEWTGWERERERERVREWVREVLRVYSIHYTANQRADPSYIYIYIGVPQAQAGATRDMGEARLPWWTCPRSEWSSWSKSPRWSTPSPPPGPFRCWDRPACLVTWKTDMRMGLLFSELLPASSLHFCKNWSPPRLHITAAGSRQGQLGSKGQKTRLGCFLKRRSVLFCP